MKEHTAAVKGEGNAPRVDWQTWAGCLPQSRIDRIAFKTGFRTTDGSFDPSKSDEFNSAVNEARARKLGLSSAAPEAPREKLQINEPDKFRADLRKEIEKSTSQDDGYTNWAKSYRATQSPAKPAHTPDDPEIQFRPNRTEEEKRTRHTPGPWKVAVDHDNELCLLIQQGQGGIYGHIEIARIEFDGATVRSNEAYANARLIAAAPELLAACKGLLDEFRNGQNVPSNGSLDAIRFAIASVEGRAQ